MEVDLIKFKFGFTLAEVLITIVIVGVVAVMTLAPIIQKKTEKDTVVKLKSVYSILSQAFIRAVEENGTPDTWGMVAMNDAGSNITMANNFLPYLKIVKNCRAFIVLCNHCRCKVISIFCIKYYRDFHLFLN